MKMLVWRDAAGRVINLGDWDKQRALVVTNPLPTGVVRLGADGETPIWLDEAGNVVRVGEWDFALEPGPPANPVPEGVTHTEEEVVTGWDGGLYAADDPRARINDR